MDKDFEVKPGSFSIRLAEDEANEVNEVYNRCCGDPVAAAKPFFLNIVKIADSKRKIVEKEVEKYIDNPELQQEIDRLKAELHVAELRENEHSRAEMSAQLRIDNGILIEHKELVEELNIIQQAIAFEHGVDTSIDQIIIKMVKICHLVGKFIVDEKTRKELEYANRTK
jgi:uncharacterized protein with von Willebrand factor type A (vWA) domain